MAHDKIGPREALLRAQREARYAKSQATAAPPKPSKKSTLKKKGKRK